MHFFLGGGGYDFEKGGGFGHICHGLGWVEISREEGVRPWPTLQDSRSSRPTTGTAQVHDHYFSSNVSGIVEALAT